MKTFALQISALSMVLGTAVALPAVAAEPAKKADKAAAAPAVRDWAQVDTDGDGLVTPVEMERYLAAQKSTGATASK